MPERVSNEAEALLTLIDGSFNGERGLRSYPNARTQARRDIHALCLELEAAGEIYRRRQLAGQYVVWTACD